MIELEEDANSADWTKQTWDIPVSDQPTLDQWLRRQKLTRAHFMQMPVFRFNVEKFAWLANWAKEHKSDDTSDTAAVSE